jgi:hypothetical protein
MSMRLLHAYLCNYQLATTAARKFMIIMISELSRLHRKCTRYSSFVVRYFHPHVLTCISNGTIMMGPDQTINGT